MAAPLLAVGAPPVRAAGSEVLIRYDLPDPPEWHARLVLTDVGGDGHLVDYYIVFTPDMDIYAEDLGSANPDTAVLRDRPADRSSPTASPRHRSTTSRTCPPPPSCGSWSERRKGWPSQPALGWDSLLATRPILMAVCRPLELWW